MKPDARGRRLKPLLNSGISAPAAPAKPRGPNPSPAARNPRRARLPRRRPRSARARIAGLIWKSKQLPAAHTVSAAARAATLPRAPALAGRVRQASRPRSITVRAEMRVSHPFRGRARAQRRPHLAAHLDVEMHVEALGAVHLPPPPLRRPIRQFRPAFSTDKSVGGVLACARKNFLNSHPPPPAPTC